MGVMGFVGNAVNNTISAAGNVVRSAVNYVGNIASSVGSSLTTVAKTILTVAGEYFSPMLNIISSIAKLIDVLDTNDDPETLGMQAELSDKNPKDFNSYQEYINHLRNDIVIDRKKMEKASEVQRMAYQAIGATIAIKGINEQKGFEIPVKAWSVFARQNLENKETVVNAVIDSFGDKIQDYVDYAQGELKPDKEIEVGNQLAETYKTLNPDLSEADIEKKVMELELSPEHRL